MATKDDEDRDEESGDAALYVEPEGDPEQLADALARSPALHEAVKSELKWCVEHEAFTRRQQQLHRRGLPRDVDPCDLQKTGWGVIFASNVSPAIKHALRRLLDHRKRQAGKRYKELKFNPGETPEAFLWYRHGVAPGVVNLDKMPYYLLIVGGPETIPFELQYLLNADHAVGRICFETVAEHKRYADSVVDAETKGVMLPRRATFFAVNTDPTTERMNQQLVEPLRQHLVEHPAAWEVETWGQEQATKAHLTRLLGGDQTPGLLLVSCHGTEFPPGHSAQQKCQGALLCQDWPGPVLSPVANAAHYFSADDLPVADGLGLHGQITVLFACYGAGTPQFDNFPFLRGGRVNAVPELRPLAEKPFISRLGQHLLSRPDGAGGALAVVGHIDRGWSLAYSWNPLNAHIDATASLRDTLSQLLQGLPLGEAMRSLHERYISIAAHLGRLWEDVLLGREPAPEELAFLWTAHNDARNTVILGDPAVRVLGDGGGGAAMKPQLRSA